MKKPLLIASLALAVLGLGSSTMAATTPSLGILNMPIISGLSGGSHHVTYNYLIWNAGGIHGLVDVGVSDTKCNPVYLLEGDSNNNNKLDLNEKWRYSCTTSLSNTTMNTPVARGYNDDASRKLIFATTNATVAVESGHAHVLVKTNMTHKAAKVLDLACMQSGLQVRELALQDAWKNYSSATQFALDARSSALVNAWAMVDKSTMRTAITQSWHDFNTIIQAAKKVYKRADRTAWSKYRSVSRACEGNSSYGDYERGINPLEK